ncbi:hypothetical protein HMI54_000342 [Coelomomyces lativittatus]|nr:hypothetical protein HMI55_006613 [Coelomomyces lativittatus]KAJ1512031.1 hypothetical protein HMI54_000342 [Coelomomyces lativittatus]
MNKLYKEVQENSEEEQTIILHLHRQLQEKNEQISVLQHQLDDQMSSESSSPDSTSSVQSTQNSCGSLNISSNFGKAEESLKKEELVRIQEEEKEWNEKEEETSVLSGSISSYSTSHQSSNQHERSLGQSISSGHNKDSHSPQPSIFEIPFKKVKQPSMEEALHKLQKAMELRLEKTKFFYENEISNLKKTIDSYKTQQESFKECLNSFLDPSKVAIILGRQKALLELAANAIKSTPSTPLGGMQQNPPELDPLSKVTPVLSLPFHSTEKFSGNSKARKKSILKETSTTPSKGTATKKSTQSTKKAH